MDWFSISKTIAQYLWIAAGVIWLIGAFAVKRTSRTQSPSSRLLQLAIAVVAFTIGFSRRFAFDPLTRRLFPDSQAVAILGLAITAVGIGFAVWARLMLGKNWSGTVTLKENHTLVRKGPYAIVRHPIYSGLLLGLTGTFLIFNEVRMLVALVLMMVMLLLKIRTEERFMVEQFGPEYAEYAQRVKALVPFIY